MRAGGHLNEFPLFGFRLEDYDELFAEKRDLRLKIREHEHVQWSGKFPPALTGQGAYPRPFRPLVDVYRETGKQHGFSPEQLKVGVHMLGYIGQTTQEAAETLYPGYARAMTDIGKERGCRR